MENIYFLKWSICPNNICTHTGSFMFLSDTDIERHWQTGVSRQGNSQQTLLSVSQMPNEEWYLTDGWKS